jgi:hypothetical protein
LTWNIDSIKVHAFSKSIWRHFRQVILGAVVGLHVVAGPAAPVRRAGSPQDTPPVAAAISRTIHC